MSAGAKEGTGHSPTNTTDGAYRRNGVPLACLMGRG